MPYFIKSDTGVIPREISLGNKTNPVTGFDSGNSSGISRKFPKPNLAHCGNSSGNSRAYPASKSGFLNFSHINQIALREFPTLLLKWLPDGQLKGREWIARNPTRADKRPGSFCINVDTGKWADFATGDRGGDVISLAAYLTGASQGSAAKRLADHLGVRHD